ncbi:MAG TPA: SCO family protein [Pyrinomonadaceae bacterium]|nr:SCO family protein [Pyrinomonadaceae bacterium]
MKKPILLLLLLIASIGGAAACRRASGDEKRFDLKGTIVSVEPEKQQVTIAHDEVKGYMPGMTMPFTVRNAADMQMLTPKAEITATLVVDGKHSWLEDLFVVTRQEAGGTGAAVPPEAKEGDEVPNYALVNQDAKPISIKNYRGKTLLLTFIYTRCPIPDYCTLMSNNFAQIERQLGQDPELYARTHLLSISIDPAYDEPKVLRSYGAAHTERYQNETFAHWEFATGTNDQVKEIAQYFGLSYFPEKDQIIHGLRTVIVNAEGKVAKIYKGNEWKTDEVVEEIKEVSRKGAKTPS